MIEPGQNIKFNHDPMGREIDLNSCNATSKSRLNTPNENNNYENTTNNYNKSQNVVMNHDQQLYNEGLNNAYINSNVLGKGMIF